MAYTYMHRCLALFPETMQARHGWRPDYAALERELEPVRLGIREFSYHDLETIQNGHFWDFRQFWRFPRESDIEQEIDFVAMSRLLPRLPLDEEQAIARLHAALKYIENVSVVLRFIHPAHYGIISPPVEKLLEVRRGRNEVETYLNYLRDLRDVRSQHDLPRAADADMALWVLQERVLSSYRDHDLLRQFRADTWLLRRKAVNLLAELSDLTDPLDLARALVEAHLPLAGILASFELERRLRARWDGPQDVNVAGMIVALASRERSATAAADLAGRWQRAWRIRDRFIQPGERPSRKETLELIEEAGRLSMDHTEENPK